MIGFLKNIFTKPDNTTLREAVSKGAFLVDVRTPAEFSRGSVKGAVNIPLNSVSNQLSKFKNKKSIVVFCLSGGRNKQAKSILEKNAFQNVINGGTWKNVNRIIYE